jgi:hypothetical protein
MTYTEINREGFELEVDRRLSDKEWNEFLREVDKFVENANPTQEDLDDFVVSLADDYANPVGSEKPKLVAFSKLEFTKEDFERWVNEDGSVELTNIQWRKVVNELDARTANFLDELIYEVVVDVRDGDYNN